MPSMLTYLRAGAVAALLVLAGCAGGTPAANLPPVEPEEITELAAAFEALGPQVREAEAARAADIAFNYTRQLAFEYQITDSPLVHNMKVNMGLRPRGLCYEWADDLQARMEEEGFRSLQLHRAIANSENRWRLDHSTLIISARGDAWDEGIVLDPWRFGGILFWDEVTDDTEFAWQDRRDVMAVRIAELEAAGLPIPGRDFDVEARP